MSPFILLRKALQRNLLGWNKNPVLAISSTVSEALHSPKRLEWEPLMTWLWTLIKRHLPFISCDIKLMQHFRGGVEPKHCLWAPFDNTKSQSLKSELSSEIYGRFLLVCWSEKKSQLTECWRRVISQIKTLTLHLACSLKFACSLPMRIILALSVLVN